MKTIHSFFSVRKPGLLCVGILLLLWAGLSPGCGGDSAQSSEKPEDRVRVLYDKESSQEHKSTEPASSQPEPSATEPTESATEPPQASDGGMTQETPPTTELPAERMPPERVPPEQVAELPAERPAPPEPSGPLKSWIGGPCRDRADCDFADAVCLSASQGYPEGSCSQPCTRLCPDRTGKPTTFCLDLKGKIAGDGGCVARCDYGLYPNGGCRKGYHCEQKSRFQETKTQATVCLPGPAPTPSGPCYQKLQQMGVNFQTASDPKAHPSGYPNLTCSVVDALTLQPPILGVDWVNGSKKRVGMFMRCELALAMVKLSQYLKQRGINKVMHYGTYNCRTIRTDGGSTSSLSQHGLGRAIDLAAFWDTQNREYNLVKHWDHSTTWQNSSKQMGCWSTRFNSPEARVLYEIGCDMWKQKIFSLVLTPNYNNAHDNHFHVDLSSNGHIFTTSANYIGPHHGH